MDGQLAAEFITGKELALVGRPFDDIPEGRGEIWRAWVLPGPAETQKEMANCLTQELLFCAVEGGMRGEVEVGRAASGHGEGTIER